MGVCRGRLAGCGCEFGVVKVGVSVCMRVHAYICICVSMCLGTCLRSSAGEADCVCVCVHLPGRLRACVFLCFALGCWVMGPAGRAEAIHFPSATLKAASREGGVVVGVGRGGRKNEIEEKGQEEKWGDVYI